MIENVGEFRKAFKYLLLFCNDCNKSLFQKIISLINSAEQADFYVSILSQINNSKPQARVCSAKMKHREIVLLIFYSKERQKLPKTAIYGKVVQKFDLKTNSKENKRTLIYSKEKHDEFFAK